MSDHYLASIRIGGDLPRRQVARFCCLLGLNDADEQALLATMDQGVLRHEDGEARWGEFEELETACREWGLAYARVSEGYWNTLPRCEFWASGMEQPESLITDDGGEPLAPMATLCEVRNHLRNGRTAEALALLDSEIGEVPEVPPFEIVDCAPTSHRSAVEESP